MENTLENKAKFFAQYYGQIILVWHQWNVGAVRSTIDFQVPMNSKLGISEGWYLELKPLSSITDEDAIEVAKLAYVKLEEYFLEMGNHVVTLFDKDAHLGSITCQEFLSISEFLKSKGYYIGDGKEIQYGWVKLKTS